MDTAAIDLFCGIGGLSLGLEKAGVSVVAGIDLDSKCKYSYETNIGADFICKDISKIDGKELVSQYWPNLDDIRILVGCAPCQPFSTHSNKNKNRKYSQKWFLINEFKRLIEETSPTIVSMENVPNLSHQEIFIEFVSFLKSKNYFVSFSNVYCPDYGIPQRRRRLVLFASKLGNIQIIPKTHTKENYVSLRTAIGFLPPIKAGEVCQSDPLHRAANLSELNLRRIRASKPNGTWLDWDEPLRLKCHKAATGKTYKSIYGRLSWDDPSSTITTQFYNAGTGRFVHPIQDRALTIREAAILQTFPLNFKFYKNEEDIQLKPMGIHIGNAVPVDLGKVIGQSILAHLEGYYGRRL
ncbi:MAG: DNA cytosine methyltransferase [Anaerolineaceae bacterium]|jgi:DNA (cytosine-5)-methyltransferase 1|nr:DNA cytosine methyltransferase [Anaerolineaceae bacterium]